MYLELKQENSAALEGCAFCMPKREEECVLCHKWCQEICKKTHGAEEEKQCSFEGCTNRVKKGVCIMYHARCKEEEEEEVHF